MTTEPTLSGLSTAFGSPWTSSEECFEVIRSWEGERAAVKMMQLLD